MIDLDLLLVLVLVGGALASLVWRVRGPRAAPSCHAWRGPAASEEAVVVGAALARGMRAAKARRPQPTSARSLQK